MPAPASIAFDVFGTLIDLRPLAGPLAERLGGEAESFLMLWRRTQIEYAIRRAAMKQFEPFEVCARQALEFANRKHGSPLDESDKMTLLDRQKLLPSHPDSAAGLDLLKGRGHHLVAFSNGSPDSLETLLTQAGLRGKLDGVISVVEAGTFKPAREVYNHLAARLERPKGEIWLVSSNPWDVIGARSAGLKAAWVKRSPDEVFDPWEPEYEADLVVPEIPALAGRIAP